jgi:IS1 family transposase
MTNTRDKKIFMREKLPLIILTGHRKSGTSLFQRLFDGLDGINLYPTDLSILYAYFPCFTARKDITDNELRARLLHVLDQSIQYVFKHNNSVVENKEKLFNLVENEIKNIDLREKADVITAVCRAWSNYKGLTDKTIPFVFKETSQAIFFSEYKERFPRLKMVSLVRDPRDNYAAINAGVKDYYSKFGEYSIDALSSLINRARMDLIAAKINQEKFPESFLAIRFEDLVTDPRETMMKVSSFLGIEFNETMLIPELGGMGYKGNNFEGKVFSGISNSSVGAWKTRIPEATAKIIEYWMADIMEYWGYKCEFELLDRQAEFSRFYESYNCKYFYNDAFRMEGS